MQENLADKPVQIDVEQIFKKKNPMVARSLPRFILNWIKRTVHQDEINAFLKESHHLKGVEFARAVLQGFGVIHHSKGSENIPEKGGVVIVANHPLGGLDGIVLLVETAKKREDLGFIVNDILMNLPAFENLFIPVNKHGKQARRDMQRIDELYRSDKLILVFPAGLCSRKQNGKICDLDWNKSFLSRAIKNNLTIVPAHITGKNSNRFYIISRIRKWFGIKANLEMFFLADEMFKQKGNNLQVTYGKPIAPQIFNEKHSLKEWANLLRDFVYTLENGDSDFNEFLQRTPR
jgi:putative hemolysin